MLGERWGDCLAKSRPEDVLDGPGTARTRAFTARGEGGEIERRPNKPCEVITLLDGAIGEEQWLPTIADPRLGPDESMDLDRLGALWRGDIVDAYAEAAVTGTLAIALRALGEASDARQAQAKGEALWRARDRGRLLAAA